MKHQRARGIFDEQNRYLKLDKNKDPLVVLNQIINWESFRGLIDLAIDRKAGTKGGRPYYDNILMFKILILQRYYNLSDEQIEFQLLDRISFMRFLGLTIADDVPDAKTIWSFRDTLVQKQCMASLFNQFGQRLKEIGFIANEGKILDASFVQVPIQRNSPEENKQVKQKQVPEAWKEKPSKLAQKDTDAQWTKKHGRLYYGYKNHIKADAKSKLIENFTVTDASVHDSQVMYDLLEDSDSGQQLHADCAYSSAETTENIAFLEIDNQIHEKAQKGKPLTDAQKQSNKEKSRVRARVEHVFGFVANSMNGSFIRSIGIARAQANICMINLTYNIFRAIQICKIRGISLSI